jgi:hypothetical protein
MAMAMATATATTMSMPTLPTAPSIESGIEAAQRHASR